MANPTFDELLARYPSDVQALARSARQQILELLPEAEESVDTRSGVIGFGDGPGYKHLICTLIMSKSGVKLGIVGGASLPDPHGLLEGSGRVHRYMALKIAADLRRPGMKKLVEAAARMRRSRNAD